VRPDKVGAHGPISMDILLQAQWLQNFYEEQSSAPRG